jgi:hypothetical protein
MLYIIQRSWTVNDCSNGKPAKTWEETTVAYFKAFLPYLRVAAL